MSRHDAVHALLPQWGLLQLWSSYCRSRPSARLNTGGPSLGDLPLHLLLARQQAHSLASIAQGLRTGRRRVHTLGLTSASVVMSASGLYLTGSVSRAEEVPWRPGSYLGVGAWPLGLEESTASKRPSICLSRLSTCAGKATHQTLVSYQGEEFDSAF